MLIAEAHGKRCPPFPLSTQLILNHDVATHWIWINGCLMDMLASGVLCDEELAASSPTRPTGLVNTGRKSSAEKHPSIS